MTKKKTLEELVESKLKRVKELTEKKVEDKQVNSIVNQNLIKEAIENSIPLFKSPTKRSIILKTNPIETKTLCVTLSDIHIGKKNEVFNFDIFLNKLDILFDSLSKTIKEKHIAKLVVFGIGDWVDGQSIYPGHSNYICMNVAEQAIQGAKHFADVFYKLSLIVNEIEFIGVAGNHGRFGRKSEHTLTENFDYILYKIMEVHLKNINNIKFTISEDWKHFVKVGNLTFMAFHGDETAKGNPLANIPKAVAEWASMWRKMASGFDAAVCGHFHTPVLGIDVNGIEVFINGSFVDSDDYSEKQIRKSSRSGQITWIVQGNKIIDRNLIEL